MPAREYVRLQLFRGVELDDPARRLEGSGRGMRHVKVRSVSELDAASLRDFVRQAVHAVAAAAAEWFQSEPFRDVTGAATRPKRASSFADERERAGALTDVVVAQRDSNPCYQLERLRPRPLDDGAARVAGAAYHGGGA